MQPQAYFPNPQDGSPPHVVDLSGVLVADGVTPDELNLVRAQEKAPRITKFILPDRPIRLNALPPEFWNYLGEPVAINADFRTSSFVGRGANSLIQLGEETAGIQTTAGLSEGICTFRNFRIHGPGRGVGTDGKTADGGWSRDLGKYVHNGFNVDNQTIIEDVNVWHMTGNCIRGYGWREQYATGKPILVMGNLNHDFFFRPDDSAILQVAKFGWVVEVQGVKTTIGGVSGVGNYLYISPQPGIEPGDNVLLSLIPRGGALIADNCDFVRINAQFNGGAAYFLKGNDQNQHVIMHGTSASNGMQAVGDFSFLGIDVFGHHAADNGLNFKDDEEGPQIPSYHTEYETAGTTYWGCYDEMGGAPMYLAKAAMAVGTAKLYNGITGPGAQFGQESKNFQAGAAFFADRYIAFMDGRTQPTLLRNLPGNLFGFSYGDDQAGQAPHLLLGMVRKGDKVRNERGEVDAQSWEDAPVDGIITPGLYLQGALHTAAPSLPEYFRALDGRHSKPGSTVTITGDTKGPRQYMCQVGGDEDTCLFQPTIPGQGAVADRPAPETLTRHDAGYEWINTATSTKSLYTGGGWVAPQAPVALGPLSEEFIPDSSPLLRYSEGHWNHHQVSPDAPYRNQDVATRSDLVGDGTIDCYFSSEGQDDESIALYFPLDRNALFSIYLNDELAISRLEPGGLALSHGNRVVQHFTTIDFYRGGPLAANPSCVLQPAAGVNHLQLISHTPGGSDTSLYFDGAKRATRGKLLPPTLELPASS